VAQSQRQGHPIQPELRFSSSRVSHPRHAGSQASVSKNNKMDPLVHA
jgi:hypothetical protein